MPDHTGERMRVAFLIFHWQGFDPLNATTVDDEDLANLIAARGKPDRIEIRVVQQYPEPLKIAEQVFYAASPVVPAESAEHKI